MIIRKIFGIFMTALIFAAAILIGRVLWVHYMDQPWTRDGRVRADVINVAPDVSGAVVTMPVADNQLVHKGDLLMEIDPSHYKIAVEQAEATVAARQADLPTPRDHAAPPPHLANHAVPNESPPNTT